MSSALDELHTLRDFVRWGASRFNAAGLFFGHGTDNAVDEAVGLVLHALHLSYDLPDNLWEANLTREEKERILALFQEREEKRLPAPYITNKAWFAGAEFYVNEHVLIPRSPIAELIEEGFAPWLEAASVHEILDIGTGCACIAVAAALHLPHAHVDAVDVSEEALETARRNVKDYALEERVNLFYSDVFSTMGERRYDVIISNPPYVDARELSAMPDEYRHEPELALAAGKDGLDIARRILAHALEHLKPGGILIVEVGASAPALLEAYPEVEFVWPEFKRGGGGVFVLTTQQLAEYRGIFTA